MGVCMGSRETGPDLSRRVPVSYQLDAEYPVESIGPSAGRMATGAASSGCPVSTTREVYG